jgi:hypothetical protein
MAWTHRVGYPLANLASWWSRLMRHLELNLPRRGPRTTSLSQVGKHGCPFSIPPAAGVTRAWLVLSLTLFILLSSITSLKARGCAASNFCRWCFCFSLPRLLGTGDIIRRGRIDDLNTGQSWPVTSRAGAPAEDSALSFFRRLGVHSRNNERTNMSPTWSATAAPVIGNRAASANSISIVPIGAPNGAGRRRIILQKTRRWVPSARTVHPPAVQLARGGCLWRLRPMS